MRRSFCPKCNKDQPTIDAGPPHEGASDAAGTHYYRCAVCRTPVGVPRNEGERIALVPASTPLEKLV